MCQGYNPDVTGCTRTTITRFIHSITRLAHGDGVTLGWRIHMQHMMCWNFQGSTVIHLHQLVVSQNQAPFSSTSVHFEGFPETQCCKCTSAVLVGHEMGCWLPYMGMFCSTILCNNQCNSNLSWKAFVLPPTSPKNPILYSWLLRFLRTTPFSIEVGSTIFFETSHYDHSLDSPTRAARQSLLQQSQLSQSAFFEAKVGGGWCPCWWLLDAKWCQLKWWESRFMCIYESDNHDD